LELPTDAEENSLRHVDFSSPLTWDPDKLSDDIEDAWFSNGYDPDAVEIHPYAEILYRDVDLYPSNAQYRERDWILLCPYFGWKPWERISDTFQVTTQYARMALRIPMRLHFKSPYPALNVCWLDETVATDTFHANATAHDGSTCAQIYVGLKSYFITHSWVCKLMPNSPKLFEISFQLLVQCPSSTVIMLKLRFLMLSKTFFVFITFLLPRVSLITRTKTLLNAASRN
jgi:hypothetical protein